MSHHIYNTEGFIVDRREAREADASLVVFTRDFGFLSAHARSVRASHSKMRGHTVFPGHVNLSLVRGREMWRLVGIESTGLVRGVLSIPQKREVAHQIFNLLRRLMPGEEKYEDLFGDIKEAILYLSTAELSPVDVKNFECVMMLRILKSLGYLKDSDSLRSFVNFTDWQTTNISEIQSKQKEAISAINSSLSAAGL